MPDVDYSASAVDSGEVIVPAEEIPSVAEEFEVNWFGIGRDNVVRLGGDYADWDRGWLGQKSDGTLVRIK